MGLSLDANANRRSATRIDAERSSVSIFFIPTDEERMIGRHTLQLLKQHKIVESAPALA